MKLPTEETFEEFIKSVSPEELEVFASICPANSVDPDMFANPYPLKPTIIYKIKRWFAVNVIPEVKMFLVRKGLRSHY